MKYQIQKSNRQNKKYMAILENKTTVHFGDNRYKQYRDTTKLKIYSHLDHNDTKRKELYYKRHGKALPYSPKYFSHKYLWN